MRIYIFVYVFIAMISLNAFSQSVQKKDFHHQLLFIIDKADKDQSPSAQTLSVYLDQKLLHIYRVSTGIEIPVITTSGQPSDRVTPTGRFRIYYRSIDYVSNTWTNAKMPYAQFFSNGAAIHATSHYTYIGQRDSGGCVRLHPNNAKVLWDLVDKYGVKNTWVIVFDGSKDDWRQFLALSKM